MINNPTLAARLLLEIDHGNITGPYFIKPDPTLLGTLELPLIHERPLTLDPDNLAIAHLELHLDRSALAASLRQAADRIEYREGVAPAAHKHEPPLVEPTTTEWREAIQEERRRADGYNPAAIATDRLLLLALDHLRLSRPLRAAVYISDALERLTKR